jgi:heptosyltransferase-1
MMIQEPKHIMLIRLSSVGDVILATPLAKKLRECYPRARISWLVDRSYVDLVFTNPYLDSVVVFDHKGSHRGLSGIRRLARELGTVDLLIDLQHKLRSVLVSWFIWPKNRQVLNRRNKSTLFRALINHDPVLLAPHQVERNMKPLQDIGLTCDEIGQPLLKTSNQNCRQAEVVMNTLADKTPRVAIFPGSRHATKQWPVEYVIELADRCRQQGLQVALMGGQQESALIAQIAAKMRNKPNMVHSNGSLGLLAALIERCDLVVSPDSGPAHMAAALGVPTLVLFGPTSPERWAPRGENVQLIHLDLDCSPCSNHGNKKCRRGQHECLRAIEPKTVFEQVEQILAR